MANMQLWSITYLTTLSFLDTETLLPIQVIETKDTNGKSSRVRSVYNAPPRHSFVVALKDVKEVWEIPYSDKGGVEVFKGWAHD